MKIQSFITAAIAAPLLLVGCANPHFFPRARPLFPGLNEAVLPLNAKARIDEAKNDFQLARAGKQPAFALYVSTIPYTHSKIFEGRGYSLTLVDKTINMVHSQGPEIVISSSLTGGKPYLYDEIDSPID